MQRLPGQLPDLGAGAHVCSGPPPGQGAGLQQPARLPRVPPHASMIPPPYHTVPKYLPYCLPTTPPTKHGVQPFGGTAHPRLACRDPANQCIPEAHQHPSLAALAALPHTHPSAARLAVLRPPPSAIACSPLFIALSCFSFHVPSDPFLCHSVTRARKPPGACHTPSARPSCPTLHLCTLPPALLAPPAPSAGAPPQQRTHALALVPAPKRCDTATSYPASAA